MRRVAIIWISIVMIYAIFWLWYTPLGGPLSAQEIDDAVAYLTEHPNDGSDAPNPDVLARFRKFLEADTGKDFVMVNAILMNDAPLQTDAVEPGESSQDVLDRYMEYMWPALLIRASHPVFFGSAAAPSLEVLQIEGAENWSSAGLMRYRSRRDLVSIITNPKFAGAHKYKVAAMAKTFAYPVDPYVQFGGPKVLFGLIMFSLGALLHLALGRKAPKATIDA